MNRISQALVSKLRLPDGIDQREVEFDQDVGIVVRGLNDQQPILALDQGIFRAVGIEAAQTPLDTVDYDEIHSVNIAGSTHLANRYIELAAGPETKRLEVLEIGCGTGLLTAGLANVDRIDLCVSVDLSFKFLQINLTRLLPDSKIVLLCADLNQLPFSPGTFDAIVGNSILHHIFEVDKFLSNLRTFYGLAAALL